MSYLGTLACWVLAFIFLAYLIPHLLVSLLPPRDLKKAYGAKWGLVTGASSGEALHALFHAVMSPSYVPHDSTGNVPQ